MVEKTQSPGWWPNVYEPFRHLGERIADWFAPRAEAKAANDCYEITMELPGVARDDIDVTLHEGALTVKGEKHSERKEEGEGYFFSEREYGRFQRSFRLPADAREGAVAADFSNGVLKIRVPRMAAGTEAGAKKIKVTAS
jgi:HSP20 family protein